MLYGLLPHTLSVERTTLCHASTLGGRLQDIYPVSIARNDYVGVVTRQDELAVCLPCAYFLNDIVVETSCVDGVLRLIHNDRLLTHRENDHLEGGHLLASR